MYYEIFFMVITHESLFYHSLCNIKSNLFRPLSFSIDSIVFFLFSDVSTQDDPMEVSDDIIESGLL